MTDFTPPKTLVEPTLGSTAPFATPTQPPTNGYSPAEDHNSDDEAIKCICGYNEDDGNTVFCEICRTWGHVECYYPDGAVPDVHECLDCKPRPMDVEGAKERQRLSRIATSSSERKAKRAPAKNGKKRAKDANGQTNGWPTSDQYTTDRTSGSPRDQPPPSKRPKTTHRPSSSISRKRAGSNMTSHSRKKSPLQSPSTRLYSGDYITPEYMTLHEKPEFLPIQANGFTTIAVSNDLSSWLNDPEQLRKVTGKTQHDIFQRWDKAYEELEKTSPGVTRSSKEDLFLTIRDKHPVSTMLKLNSHAPAGAYIGELKGHIGRKEDYQQDPANRWAELRHPEPYVFFHDSLPIYIDSRVEGTVLRYVRRSCTPNVKIQIIINNGEYHFCLISSRDIQAGEEITLAWSVDSRFYNAMQGLHDHGNLTDADEAYCINWTSTVLANFGGCACGRRHGSCFLSRFDAREPPNSNLPNGHGLNPPKSRKKAQISPLSTGRATNSRAASEAINATDPDDDNVDARSSSRSKPTSRDITPMTATLEGAAFAGTEMSDRERRKILQQERLFQQLENTENSYRRGKKRSSAGSYASTTVRIPYIPPDELWDLPSGNEMWILITNNEQKHAGSSDVAVASPMSVGPSKTRLNGLTTPGGVSKSSRHNSSGPSPNQRRTKPVYANASTQTEKKPPEPPSALTLLRRQRGSNELLRFKKFRDKYISWHPLSAEEKASMESRQASFSLSPTPGKGSATSAKEASAAMPPPPVPSSPDTQRVEPSIPASSPPASVTEEKQDIAMKEVDTESKEEETLPAVSTAATSVPTVSETSPTQSNGITLSSAPSWPSVVSTTSTKSTTTSKNPDLHVQLPPAPIFSTQTQTPTTPPVSTPTPGSITSNAIIESPSSSMTANAPIFSPSVATAVAPSPMKKKLSLSDYTNRKKRNEALAQQAQQQAASSNLSQPPTTPAAGDEKDKETVATTSDKPSVPQESSNVLEEVDMPLPPPKSEDADASSTTAEVKDAVN